MTTPSGRAHLQRAWDLRQADSAPSGGPVRSIGPLGRVLVAMLVLVALVDIYAIGVGVDHLDLVGRVTAGAGSVSDREIDQAEDTYNGAGIVQLALFAVTGVLFLVWFVRAYRNVAARGGYLRHSGGWAIAAWFVPVVNFFGPKQVTDDIWRGSGETVERQERVPPYVHLWWATFVVAGLLGRLVPRSLGGETVERILRQVQLGIGFDAISVVLDVLAVAVVWGLTKRQMRWTGENPRLS